MTSRTSVSSASLYKTSRWQKMRARQLKIEPFCQCPHHLKSRVVATVVDHKVAHKGDKRLFFNPKNLQSMAKTCHDRFKQSQEKGGAGFDKGCDDSGAPLNPDHPWYG